jgi:hypothetical protein
LGVEVVKHVCKAPQNIHLGVVVVGGATRPYRAVHEETVSCVVYVLVDIGLFRVRVPIVVVARLMAWYFIV